MIDFFSTIPNCLPLQIEVCRENIEWASNEKRIFLKQSLETRLVALYLDNKMYHQALDLIAQLLKELKRLDDKMMLVEVQLLESRVCHALRNIPKSRVSYIQVGVSGALHGVRILISLGDAGCSHIRTYICKRNLLPAIAASCAWYAIRCLALWRKRLQDRILIFLWDIWRIFRSGWFQGCACSQVYASL